MKVSYRPARIMNSYGHILWISIARSGHDCYLLFLTMHKHQHFPIGNTSSNGGSPRKITKKSKKCCLFDFFPPQKWVCHFNDPCYVLKEGRWWWFLFPNHFPRLDLPRRSENFRTRWPGTFFRGGTGEKKQRGAPPQKITRLFLRQVVGGIWYFVFGGCLFFKWLESGQITIFHQPRFPWKRGFPLLKHHLGAQVVCDRYNLTRMMACKLGIIRFQEQIRRFHVKLQRVYKLGVPSQ